MKSTGMVDPAALIVAATALVATYYGARQAQQGRLDSKRQQDAANKLEERELRHKETESALTHAYEDADRARQLLREERAEGEEKRKLLAAEVVRLAKERDDVDAHLRGQLRTLDSDLAAMRTLVVGQINDEATRTAEEGAP